jgi:amino acid adenylation domain-containing protein
MSTRRPVSPLQRVMLLDALLGPRHGGYVLQNRFPLRHGLDEERLRVAWQDTADRRAVMRTTFDLSGPPACWQQEVLPLAELAWMTLDWRWMSPEVRERAHADLLSLDRATPFDLASGPPQRFTLIRLEDEAYELLWTSHHASMDGRSYLTVATEAFLRYDGLELSGLPADRPFSLMLDWMAGRDHAEELAWWREALSGMVATPVPGARSRPLAAHEEPFGDLTVHLGPDRTRALLETARRLRVTGNAFVHAAWALLLHRATGQSDIVFGSTRGGRQAPDELGEPLPLGMVLQTLPLRVQIEPGLSAAAFVQGVGARQRELRKLEHTPSEVLLAASGMPLEAALFETVVVYNDATFEGYLRSHGGPQWSQRRCVVLERPHAPLMLNASLDESLELRFGWFRSRVDEAVVPTLAALYLRLLERLTDSTATLADVLASVTLTQEQAKQLGLFAAFWSRHQDEHDGIRVRVRTDSLEGVVDVPPLPPGLGLDEWGEILAAGLLHPGGEAPLEVTLGESLRWTFAGAVPSPSGVARLERFVAASEHGALDAIALCSESEARVDGPPRPVGPSVPEMFFARAHERPQDVAVVHMSTPWTYGALADRVSAVAAELTARGIGEGARVAVYLDRGVDLVAGLLATGAVGAAYVPLDPLFPPERVQLMLEDAGVAAVITSTAREKDLPDSVSRVRVDEVPAASAWVSPRPGHVAYVLYTSGSTGRPKGVVVSHESLANVLASFLAHPGLGASDHLLAVTTVSFDIAALELFGPLVAGARLEIADTTNPIALRQQLEHSRPTVMQATPSTWRLLVSAGWPGDRALRVWCGGEALPADLAGELCARAGAVYNLYGPTETTIWSTVARVVAGRPVVLGEPVANTSLVVLDRAGLPVPPGTPGELYIGGVGVAQGYHQQETLTAERFVLRGTERWYRTGDRVVWDGGLRYLGRLDDQIKLHGYRIELGEIEAVLRAHPAVADAVVRADPEQGLVGYVVLRGELPDLRQHLARTLPAYMIPTTFGTLPHLPRTPNGKVDRRALPQVLPAAGAPVELAVAERVVTAAWRRALGRDGVAVDQNFFEAGGRSLELLEIVVALRAELGVPVTSTDLLRHPTIRATARFLAGLPEPVDEPAPRHSMARLRASRLQART